MELYHMDNEGRCSGSVGRQNFHIRGWSASSGEFTYFSSHRGNTFIARPCSKRFGMLAIGTTGTLWVCHIIHLGDERLRATCGSLAVSCDVVSIFLVSDFHLCKSATKIIDRSRWPLMQQLRLHVGQRVPRPLAMPRYRTPGKAADEIDLSSPGIWIHQKE
jgi:hypothetical protein